MRCPSRGHAPRSCRPTQKNPANGKAGVLDCLQLPDWPEGQGEYEITGGAWCISFGLSCYCAAYALRRRRPNDKTQNAGGACPTQKADTQCCRLCPNCHGRQCALFFVCTTGSFKPDHRASAHTSISSASRYRRRVRRAGFASAPRSLSSHARHNQWQHLHAAGHRDFRTWAAFSTPVRACGSFSQIGFQLRECGGSCHSTIAARATNPSSARASQPLDDCGPKPAFRPVRWRPSG